MNVTIGLSEAQAKAFKAQAKAQGLSVEAWLKGLAAQYAPPADSIAHFQRTDPEEWARLFRAWAESLDPETPVLSDEAMSRESIYPDRL